MKRRFMSAMLLLICSGCVTAPLMSYTVNQSLSMTEMRYQEVMNALAMVAHNNGDLPSYSLTAGGAANVTATVNMDATTQWTRVVNGFAQQMLTITGKHSPELQWQLDPVAEQPLLEGAWFACKWAINGPPPRGTFEFNFLRRAEPNDIVSKQALTQREYHLGVFDQNRPIDPNSPIPYGWLGVGTHCAAHGACYQAHCGETFVWVMPENLPALAEFTLVLLDIATIDPAWLAQQIQRPLASVDRLIPGGADPKSLMTETWLAYQEDRPDGSTKIVVAPLPGLPGAHVIEKSTLQVDMSPIQVSSLPTPPRAMAFTTGPTTTPFVAAPNTPYLSAPVAAPTSPSVHVYGH